MANWQDEYNAKKITAEEALTKIPAHSHVGMPDGVGEPRYVLEAVTTQFEKLTDVTFFQASSMNRMNFFEPEMAGHIRYECFIGTPGNKDAYWKGLFSGRADYVPAYFSTVEGMIADGSYPIDVALISVSAPDKHGWCSYGVSCDYQQTLVDAADIVIAQVNDQMPRVHGNNWVHVSDFDWVVEVSEPVLVAPAPPTSDTELKVAEIVASMVPDGATIQAGIGKLPNAILEALRDHKDLGVHSEVFTNSMMELCEAGVITNRKKTIHRGVSIATFTQGTKELYDYLDDNPAVGFYPVGYVNDPNIIAQNDNMISINSCVEVDLFGQVSAESIGYKQISGCGGQVDYVRGATMSRGGKSIIAMTSTVKHGEVSRIKLFLDSGTPITTPRDEIAYVVTEYGIAKLRGKSNSQRAAALIDIAHPDFRDELREQYKAIYSVYPQA